MYPTDLPNDFDRIARIKKLALFEWISIAMLPATKPSQHTSYWLKHEFERDAFYITNGQFKGAMSLCGYTPIGSALDANCRYRCRPSYRNRNTRDAEAGRYLLTHLKPEQRALFDRLVTAVRKCELERTGYPVCVLVADPDSSFAKATADQLNDIGCFSEPFCGDLAGIANAASQWRLVLTQDPTLARSIRAGAPDVDVILMDSTARVPRVLEPGIVALPPPVTKVLLRAALRLIQKYGVNAAMAA